MWLLGPDEEPKCYIKEYTDPKRYYCEGNAKLEDKKCIDINKELAFQEHICPEGYTKLEDETCINFNKTIDKEQGYICNEPFSKIINNTCIIYDAIEANNKE